MNNQLFRVGDRVNCIHPLTKGEVEITKYPHIDNQGEDWNWVGINGNQLMHIKYLHSPVRDEEPEEFSNNDRWNPAHFGEVPRQIEEDGQASIFFDTSDEPPEPDDFDTVEEFKEVWREWESGRQECFLVGEAGIQKVLLPQDTNQSGQLKATPMPQLSTEGDSQESDSSSKTLLPLATNSSGLSLLPKSSLPVFHAPITPFVEKGQELKDLAVNCFLNSSDFWKSKSLSCFSLKMSADSLVVEMAKTSTKSSERLQRWGIWGLGKLETAIATPPKTESASLLWVSTCDIRATQPKPGKKFLSDIIGEGNAIVYRAADGDRIYTDQAPCLRSQKDAGTGAYKIREYQGETYIERPINATEAEQLMGWEIGSTATGINKEGDEITISQTQRIKMLGNAIIPAEITDILIALKLTLEQKLLFEVPSGYEFVYRQLRQSGMNHTNAIEKLSNGENIPQTRPIN